MCNGATRCTNLTLQPCPLCDKTGQHCIYPPCAHSFKGTCESGSRCMLCLQMLGLEIREVRVVAREDIRKTERQQMHASRNSRTQVSCASCQCCQATRHNAAVKYIHLLSCHFTILCFGKQLPFLLHCMTAAFHAQLVLCFAPDRCCTCAGEVLR